MLPESSRCAIWRPTSTRRLLTCMILVACWASPLQAQEQAKEHDDPRPLAHTIRLDRQREAVRPAEPRIVALGDKLLIVWMRYVERKGMFEESQLMYLVLDSTTLRPVEAAKPISAAGASIADPQVTAAYESVVLTYKQGTKICSIRMDTSSLVFDESTRVEKSLSPLADFPVHCLLSKGRFVLFSNQVMPSVEVPVLSCSNSVMKRIGAIDSHTGFDGSKLHITAANAPPRSSVIDLVGYSEASDGSKAFAMKVDRRTLAITETTRFGDNGKIRRLDTFHPSSPRFTDLPSFDGPVMSSLDGRSIALWIACAVGGEDALTVASGSTSASWGAPTIVRRAPAATVFLPTVCLGSDNLFALSWLERSKEDTFALKYSILSDFSVPELIVVHEAASGIAIGSWPGFSRSASWDSLGRVCLVWCGTYEAQSGLFITTCEIKRT